MTLAYQVKRYKGIGTDYMFRHSYAFLLYYTLGNLPAPPKHLAFRDPFNIYLLSTADFAFLHLT